MTALTENLKITAAQILKTNMKMTKRALLLFYKYKKMTLMMTSSSKILLTRSNSMSVGRMRVTIISQIASARRKVSNQKRQTWVILKKTL